MNKYIMMFVAAIALVSCSDDVLEAPSTPVEAGAEVQFGLSLEGTRTVYGPKGATAYPIYWTEGDKVQIYSPDCLEGRNNAEYKVVIPKNEKNETVTDPDYADELQKTGPYGIQWGKKATAKFYSLYPSGNYKMSTDTDGTKKAEGLNIAYTQNVYVNEDKVSVTSLMEECFMYAQSGDVNKGDFVNLQYKPVTTTFMLTLKTTGSKDDFLINSISLTAPNATIAGDFSIKIADGSFAEWGTNKGNTVTAQIFDKATGGLFTLAKDQMITIPLFIAPVSDLNIDGWYVTVATNMGTYKKTLKMTDTNDKKGVVNAGEVHCITLPTLATEVDTEWDVANWMKNIPRNVYLSEVSIPGTWNSLNPDFQTELTIPVQYAKGVRAFHLDTRWQREWIPEGFLGLGGHYEYTLGVANGGSTSGGSTDKYDNDSPKFVDCINQILEKISPDEYMVLICSFAQNSADVSGTNGKWYSEISAICNEYDDVYDAKNLTPNTVVGDVLGKLIVLVNMPSEISETTVLPADSKCLFTYLPSELTKGHFDGTDDNQDDMWVYSSSTASKDSEIHIYNNQAQITSNNADGFTTSSRGYAPSVTERTAVLDKIVNWSRANYGLEDYEHDQWIYLGLGGYKTSSSDAKSVDGSYVAIETEYNSWINTKVEAMGVNNVPFYPVGIVLMNNKNGVTNYTGKKNSEGKEYNFNYVVKNILLLNNKYRLQYDSSKPADYNPNNKARSDYDGSLTNGGNAIQ